MTPDAGGVARPSVFRREDWTSLGASSWQCTESGIRLGRSDGSLLRAVVEDLRWRLDSPALTLLMLLGINGLARCIAVMKDERLGGRLLVRPEVVESVGLALDDLGLLWVRGKNGFVVDGRGTDREHVGMFSPHMNHPGSRTIMYISKIVEFLDAAESLEIAEHHPTLAKWYGYPACCADAYISQSGGQLDRTALGPPALGPFPSVMNPLSFHLFGIQLYFHFPCEPSCSKTVAIARRRLSWLTTLSYYAGVLDEAIEGIGLYGPGLGAVLVTEFEKVSADEYDIIRVVVRDRRGWQSIAGLRSSVLRLFDRNGIELGGRVFSGDTCAAIYQVE